MSISLPSVSVTQFAGYVLQDKLPSIIHQLFMPLHSVSAGAGAGVSSLYWI